MIVQVVLAPFDVPYRLLCLGLLVFLRGVQYGKVVELELTLALRMSSRWAVEYRPWLVH